MNNTGKKTGVWDWVNLKIFIPGVICLMIFICAGVFFPSRFYNILDFIQSVFMSRFKWVYVLCAIMTSGVLIYLLFSKTGNIRFGGRNAKPLVSTLSWVTIWTRKRLSPTSTKRSGKRLATPFESRNCSVKKRPGN